MDAMLQINVNAHIKKNKLNGKAEVCVKADGLSWAALAGTSHCIRSAALWHTAATHRHNGWPALPLTHTHSVQVHWNALWSSAFHHFVLKLSFHSHSPSETDEERQREGGKCRDNHFSSDSFNWKLCLCAETYCTSQTISYHMGF